MADTNKGRKSVRRGEHVASDPGREGGE